MKSVLYLLIVLGTLLTVLPSCKKSADAGPETQTIHKSLRVNEAYQIDLGYYGDEEGALISKQASHYAISALDRETNLEQIFYRYVPAFNFEGVDEVEIKLMRGWPNSKSSYITIKFTIAN